MVHANERGYKMRNWKIYPRYYEGVINTSLMNQAQIADSNFQIEWSTSDFYDTPIEIEVWL